MDFTLISKDDLVSSLGIDESIEIECFEQYEHHSHEVKVSTTLKSTPSMPTIKGKGTEVAEIGHGTSGKT